MTGPNERVPMPNDMAFWEQLSPLSGPRGSKNSFRGEDEDITQDANLERSRLQSILRGRLRDHLARNHGISEPSAEDRERHVSFCAERGVEVVQFSVEEQRGPLPTTTRAPRRIFGGELQNHMPGISGGFNGSGLRPSVHGRHVERLPNVYPAPATAPIPVMRDSDVLRQRPGIRDLPPGTPPD